MTMRLLPPQLPTECALKMPVQAFGGNSPACHEVSTAPQGIGSRRMLLLLITLVLAAAASTEVRIALMRDGASAWDMALMLLFVPLFGLLAFGFVQAATGFILLMAGQHPGFIAPPIWREAPHGRTAVLIPIHNEPIQDVCDRIRAMAQSIDEAGAGGAFEFFLLSDSNVSMAAEEERAWARLATQSPVPVWYRRRAKNIARKPGNIAEWVRRFGGRYAYMLVLDADSLMSGQAMISLATLMDERPSIGLLQTVPAIIEAASPFQRWMQFASRLYGPIASTGLLWWSGSEAPFWGHNAIIRTRAFAESCGLPELSGTPPFGGHIMSHDVLEAALLRRRGWAVHMVMIAGSYEETPPTMIDHAIRDRRWAQGNLQHLRVLDVVGLKFVNRVHLALGAAAYMTAPGWLLLILTTLGQGLAGPTDAFVNSAPPGSVLGLTLVLLFGPKAMALGWALADPDRRRAFGGAGRLLRSVAAEVPLSILMAPATALTQTIDLINILSGRSSGWHPQNRSSEGLALRDVLRRYRWHLALGVVFLGLAPLAPVQVLWMLPVTLGLLAAPWLTIWTSRADLGDRMMESGLFQVPESSIRAERAIEHPTGSPAEPGGHGVLISAKIIPLSHWRAGDGVLVEAPTNRADTVRLRD